MHRHRPWQHRVFVTMRVVGVMAVVVGGIMLLDAVTPHPGAGYPGGLVYAVEETVGLGGLASGCLLSLVGWLFPRA